MPFEGIHKYTETALCSRQEHTKIEEKITELAQHQTFAYWSGIGRGKNGHKYFMGIAPILYCINKKNNIPIPKP